MISGVGIATAVTPQQQTTRLEQVPEAAVSSAVQASSNKITPVLSSRIRVDNLLDVAILEVRSSDTGEIIRQYPTEQQIEAFQRAEQAEVAADQRAVAASEFAGTSETGGTQQIQPAPQQQAVSVENTAPQQVQSQPQQSTQTSYVQTAPAVSTAVASSPAPTQSILV